jgi:hypothetical protein
MIHVTNHSLAYIFVLCWYTGIPVITFVPNGAIEQRTFHSFERKGNMTPITISRSLTLYQAGPLISKEQVSITYRSYGMCRIAVHFRYKQKAFALASFSEGVTFQKTNFSLLPP